MAVSLADLRLHERALLLALHDERGTIHRAGMYAYAVAGGLLAELLLEGRIELVERKRGKPLVTVARATQVGDPVADELLERIRTAKRRAPLDRWVGRVAGSARLKHRVAVQLARKGVLRQEEERVLLLFRRKIYPEIDPAPERQLIASLREALLGDSDQVEQRTAILAVLGWHAGLLRSALDRKELKGRKQRVEALARGDAVADATKAAIAAVQAAATAAMIASSAAASASS